MSGLLLTTLTKPTNVRHRNGEILRVLALVPAHNEEEGIGACLDALLAQTLMPSDVVVVADNCTDRTENIALARGVRVFRTVGNRAKKAGALNQALAALDIDTAEAVLVLDADSILALDFVRQAASYLRRGYAAVGGNFRGAAGAGLLGAFQRNEYARYARDVARRKGRCLVLTGTASLFAVDAIRAVMNERGDGKLYDETVLTEDNELTLRLLHMGRKVISPQECTLLTEVMPTWRALARQRLRWKRGAIQNLVQFGWTPITRPYWGRQLLSFFGVFVTVMYMLTIILGIIFTGLTVYPLWLAVTGIFAIERFVTVRERGFRWQLFGALIFVEFIYDVFLQAVQARAYADALLGRTGRW